MDKAVAKRLIDELLKCTKMLDTAEVVARDIADSSEQARTRRAIMEVSGALYVEVMRDIFLQHPDLDPDPKGRRANR